MSTLTKNLNMSKPEDGDNNWGDEYRGALDIIDSILRSHQLAENPPHSGLNFAYKNGLVRSVNTVTSVVAGSILLTDDTTNYIEVAPTDGTISANTTGFTVGKIPLFTVITASGEVDTVTDVRVFLADSLGKGTARQLLAMDASGNTYEWYTPERTRGLMFYLEGNSQALAVDDEISCVVPCAVTAVNVLLNAGIGPTGSDLTIDVHLDGVTIFTTQANRPKITAGNTSSESVAPDITAIPAKSLLTFIVDTIGSTIPGGKLSGTLVCEEV